MSVCALAVWRGRDDERLAAAALLANWALSVLAVKMNGASATWEALVLDSALLAAYVWLALRSQRHWPMFAAAFQFLVVVTHLGRAADPSVSTWAYMTAAIVWGYLVLATIGYGALTAPRRYAEIAALEGPLAVPGATRR